MLKRKNEEDTSKQAKRVALDSEMNLGETDKPKHGGPYEDDPTYIHIRMLCQVKEASLVVGKRGDTINHIKEVSATRINVSENIRGVMERVIHVRGPAENVAKAFGLIARAILGEPEEVPSGPDSHPLQLQLLVPHHSIGYVIGKQGSRFREIEDASASKLSASPSSLPFSTDRVLSISGVADALHIAVYYVAQTLIECKPLVRAEPIFYNPGSVQPMMMNPMMVSFPGRQTPMQHHPHHQHHTQFNPAFKPRYNPQQRAQPQPFSHFGAQGLTLPLQTQSQEIFIPDEYVGNVIGKAGKSIKHMKEASGSQIIIADREEGQTKRKITLVGTVQSNQAAIIMINNRIEKDKRANEDRAKRDLSSAPTTATDVKNVDVSAIHED